MGRTLIPFAVLVGSLILASSPVAASVGYSSIVKLGATTSYVSGPNAIARTASSTSARLHAVYTSKRIDGANVTDTGPYQGIYYRRSSTGSTWTTPKRLNNALEHGDYASVASSGTKLFVVWRTQTHIEDYEVTTDPYLIRFRANDNQGSSTAWRSSILLTTFGRVDRPQIAASGSNVYVIYTERDGGEVRLLRSTDSGKTWGSPMAVGATLDAPFLNYGYVGSAAVAVTGSTVAISYTSDGDIVTRVSTNGGASFGAPDTRSTADGVPSLTARSGRIGLAYGDRTGVYARIRTSGGWQAWRKAATYPSSLYAEGYNSGAGRFEVPDIVLFSTGGVGLAFSSCTTSPCAKDGASRASLRWRQSTNNGATWGSAASIASGKVTTQRGFNGDPSVVMVGSTTRHVVWNGRSALGATNAAAPYFRTMTGTP